MVLPFGNLVALGLEPVFLWLGLDFVRWVSGQFKSAPDPKNLAGASIHWQVVARGNLFHLGIMILMIADTLTEQVEFPLQTSLLLHGFALLCAGSAKLLRDSAGKQVGLARGEDKLHHAFAPEACDPGTQGSRLVTGGVFGWVRHPIYLSYLVANLAAVSRMALHTLYGPMPWYKCVCWAGGLGHLVYITAFVFISSLSEEAALLDSDLGDDYKKYKARVRSRIVPGLF
eukprot:TRINITY_DN20258_c0_g1_i3.p2 TRINITY_DN20258_c0_g1~~TRINITY_DN20258_c0_g1_i3.p2  ORF type:complete len:229 (-),score=49.70 TRINITY_DN20258_c0_g1_i3:265-951(-)